MIMEECHASQSSDQYSVQLLLKSRGHSVPAELRVLQHGLEIRRSQMHGSQTNPTYDPTAVRIQREQLIDCCRVNVRRFYFFGKSRGLVRIRYLKFTDDASKKNPQVGYGFVLKEQSVYLVAIEKIMMETLVQRVQALISSGCAGLKPYLVFINPHSGAGKSLSMFQTTVAPMFNRLRIPYEVVKTAYPGHAESWIQHSTSSNLAKYRALITVSGDGLIYEIVNGLAYRDNEVNEAHTDNEREQQGEKKLNREYASTGNFGSIPLGFLPAGGGNASASAMCYFSGLASRENCLVHSAFILSHDPPTSKLSPPSQQTAMHSVQQISRLDAILFETANPRTQRIGVLSIEWGGLAELDLRSESFRWLGQTRFAVATLMSMTNSKIYRAKLSYLPVTKDKLTVPEISTSGDQIPNPSSVNELMIPEPSEVPSKDLNHFQNDTMTTGVLPWAKSVYSINAQEKWKRHYLPAIDEPIPSSWETITDDFWTILITNHSHISSEAKLHPHARFDNGQLNLILINTTVKTTDLMGLSQHLATGDGLRDTSYWKTIPVLAVRVEPELSSSCTMLDGEQVTPGPFQAEVVPSQFSVITCPIHKSAKPAES